MKEENENSPFNNEPGNFGLPEGYFERSAKSIFTKIEWQEEHEEFPKLLEVKKHQEVGSGFIVPPQYFERSRESFESIQYPSLFSLKKITGFKVPEGYFERSEERELGKVMLDEEDELSSFSKLKKLPKQNHFSVEKDFFAKSEKEIHKLLVNQTRGRIISLFGRRSAFAAAAIMLFAMGFWIYDFYFSPVELRDCGTMACVDKHDLVKTKNLEGLDNDELYELVNPSDLEKTLNTKEKMDNKETKDSSLKNVSTEDLLDEI